MSFTGSIRSARVLQHSDNVPLCECKVPCKGPTQVKKQNHNHGRWFYSCQSGACNFFKWAPDQPNPSSNAAGGSNSSPSGRSGGQGNFPASGGRILGGAGGGGEALQGGGVPWAGGSPSSMMGSPNRSMQHQQQYQAQHVQGSPYAFGQQQQQQLMGSPVPAAQRLRQANSQGPSPSRSADGGNGQLVVQLELMEGAPDRFVSRQRYSRDFIDAVKSTDRRSTEYAWDAEERVWTYALTYGSFAMLSETLEREGFRVVSAPALLERLGIPSQEAFAGMKRPGPGHPHGPASAAAIGAGSPSSHRSKLRRVNLFGDEAHPPFPSLEFDLTYFPQGTQAASRAQASGSGLGRREESKQEEAVPGRGAPGVRLPGAAGSAEEVLVVAETQGPSPSQQGPQGRHRSRQAGRGTGAAGNSAGGLQQHGVSPSLGSGAGGDGRVSAVIDLTLTDDEGEGEQRSVGGAAQRRQRRGANLGQPAAAAIARADAEMSQARNAGGVGGAGAGSAAGSAALGQAHAAAAAGAAASGGAAAGGADEGTGGLECVICLSAPREVGLLHGGTMHLCVCKDCSKVMRTRHPCPICRAPITKIISVYT